MVGDWASGRVGRSIVAVLVQTSACGPATDDERDLGEVIESIADLPSEIPDGAAQDGDCQNVPACVAGPAEASPVITTPGELAALRGVRCIAGSLRIGGAGITDLTDLASLEVVCDGIRIEGSPDLIDTGGLVALGPTTRITISDSPRLERVIMPEGYSGQLTIERAAALESLADLAALTSLDLRVRECESLRVVSLPALVEGEVALSDNPKLERLELPQLETARVNLANNAVLAWLSLPALRDADEIIISDSPSLMGIESPALERLGALRVDGPTGFTDVPALGAVVEVDTISLQNHPTVDELTWVAGLTRVGNLRILWNAAHDQELAETVAQAVAEDSKVAGNAGWSTAQLCPFENDAECDEVECHTTTALCAVGSDAADCCGFGCSLDCPDVGGS